LPAHIQTALAPPGLHDSGALPRPSLCDDGKDQEPKMTETDASTRDLLRDTATRLFQDLCEPEALRAAEGCHWPAAIWSAVEDAGLPKALVP
jgi:hypothetical protein